MRIEIVIERPRWLNKRNTTKTARIAAALSLTAVSILSVGIPANVGEPQTSDSTGATPTTTRTTDTVIPHPTQELFDKIPISNPG